jgi:hypothetical protein
VSADLQDLYAAVEVGGPHHCNAAALQGYSLHLHAVRHHSKRLVTGFARYAPLSPVLLELKVTHVQNAAEKHVAFSGAGRSRDWDNLRAIFPELLRSQKDVAEFGEGN